MRHPIAACLLMIPGLFAPFADCPAAQGAPDGECVVLLHGLARTKNSMNTLEKFLVKAGYMVVNQSYPSRKKPIQELAGQAVGSALETCHKLNAQKIHFVTHSMGGILVRYYLEKHHSLQNLGRMVMISPPNHGSQAVDRLKNFFLFKWLNGPAGRQLGTDHQSVPLHLGPARCDTGIITGDRSVNPLLSLMIPGKDDGKVSIKSAQLKGMKDFMVVHRSHPFIMNDGTVCRQVAAFIRNGRFSRD